MLKRGMRGIILMISLKLTLKSLQNILITTVVAILPYWFETQFMSLFEGFS